jgi:hypothetical protein
MSDQYHGNCAGYATDYWDQFYTYYGANKSISNWMEVVANNGDGNTHVDCIYQNRVSSNWSSLFDRANAHSQNEVWLFAANTGNETAVSNFCEAAWTKGWLLQKFQYVIINYRCDELPACTKCSWEPEKGYWYIDDINYTSIYQYMSY